MCCLSLHASVFPLLDKTAAQNSRDCLDYMLSSLRPENLLPSHMESPPKQRVEYDFGQTMHVFNVFSLYIKRMKIQ